MREQALRTLGFGEGDDVADGFGAGHERDQPVHTEGQAAVRGRAVLQGVEQEAEFGLGVFGRDFECGKHFALHVGAVNADGAAAQLPAVEHHVVSLGQALARVAVHEVFVAVFGAGEGVMHGVPAVFFFVELEHGEVHHP